MGDVVLVCALVLMAGASAFFSSRITTPRVPMQWGIDGKPTWYAPKAAGLWGLILLAIAVRAGLYAAQVYVPHKVHNLDVGVGGFAVVMALTHLFLLWRWSRSSE
jgi:hypothetical protein